MFLSALHFRTTSTLFGQLTVHSVDAHVPAAIGEQRSTPKAAFISTEPASWNTRPVLQQCVQSHTAAKRSRRGEHGSVTTNSPFAGISGQ